MDEKRELFQIITKDEGIWVVAYYSSVANPDKPIIELARVRKTMLSDEESFGRFADLLTGSVRGIMAELGETEVEFIDVERRLGPGVEDTEELRALERRLSEKVKDIDIMMRGVYGSKRVEVVVVTESRGQGSVISNIIDDRRLEVVLKKAAAKVSLQDEQTRTH